MGKNLGGKPAHLNIMGCFVETPDFEQWGLQENLHGSSSEHLIVMKERRGVYNNQYIDLARPSSYMQ